MTKITSGSLCLLLASVVVMYGCSKTQSASNTPHVPGAVFTTDISQSPYYGDTILYTQATPINTLGAGHFVAWPEGLSIDARSGAIDVSKSEPGSRYNVGFVNDRTGDTAFNQLIVAGASYPDGIYYSDAQETLLQPYYNAGTADLSGKGARFGEMATDQGGTAIGTDPAITTDPATGDAILATDPVTGAIDLKAALRNGLFGANPQNGDTRQVVVYYRLNDGSKMSLQKTSLTFRYYNTLPDVPAELAAKIQAVPHVGAITTMGSGTVTVTGTSTPVAAKKAAPAPVAPRPPQIVIVNKGH